MASMTNFNGIDAQEVLTFLLQTGSIKLDDVQADMKLAERKKILENHPYPITQGKDGRWRTYIKLDDGKRKQIAKASLEKVQDALVDFYSGKIHEDKARAATLESLYPEWCEWKVLHRAASSYMKRIDNDWKSYYRDHEIVKIPLQKLDKLTLDRFAHELIEKTGRRRKSYYNASIIIRSIFDLAVDKGLVKENTFRQVKIDAKMVFDPEKKKPSETQVYSPEELEQLLQFAWEDFKTGHNTVQKLAPLAVMFSFQTGLRRGEVTCLRYEDLCDDEICIQRMYRFESNEVIPYTKGHRDCRYVPLTKEAKRIINIARQYQQEHGLDDSGYIFSVEGNKPLSYYSVGQLFNRYCDLIGTIPKSSHKARKTYISTLIDGGVNINTVREIVAHASEKTTYNSYVFDRKTKSERTELIEKALS